ncbi:MAG: site-2 protease family protein [Terriglobales bacterium]
MRGTWKLARFFGIDLYLHWSWFLVVLLEFQDRGAAYTSPIWNLFEILVLFAIVTLHEYGHALACRQVGGHANQIMLWPFGGIAYVDPPVRPAATLWTITAGPLVNVILIPILLPLLSISPANNNLYQFAHSIFWINLGLLIFNIIPVYPLDGGQILRSLLWFPFGRANSLLAAALIGFVGVAALFVLSWRLGDLWLAAITVFILLYCWKGLQSARRLWALSKLPHHDGLACPWCQAAPPAEPLWRCRQCQNAFDAFAVTACPACHTASQMIPCPECGHSYPITRWASASTAVTARR